MLPVPSPERMEKIMNKDELRHQMQEKLSRAYSLAFDHIPERDQRHLRHNFETKDWEQVLFHLLSYLRNNTDITPEIKEIVESAKSDYDDIQVLLFEDVLTKLSPADLIHIKECLLAGANGLFFTDGDFPLIIGASRDEIRELALGWPHNVTEKKKVNSQINNILNNLLFYPIDRKETWNDYLSINPEEVYQLLRRFRFAINEIDYSGMGAKEGFLNMK
jgi:hypothetical protein